ncbi:MAG: CPBP family intramembrane metalloprotease [Anaerolineae bacterium]|jgi:hypothetical protein
MAGESPREGFGEGFPAPPVPWTSRDVWLGVGGLVLWLLLALGLVLLASFFAPDMNVGLLISLLELALLLPVWWLALRKYGARWQDLGLRGFRGVALGMGCGLMFLSFLFNGLYNTLLALFDLQAQPDLIPLLAELDSPWFLLVGAILVAPVVEEIFFRGFVYAGLRARYGWKRAAVVSALLFAAIHLQPTAALPIFVLGLIFAFLYEWSSSIWPAIVMHFASNALAIGAAYLVIQAGLTT